MRLRWIYRVTFLTLMAMTAGWILVAANVRVPKLVTAVQSALWGPVNSAQLVYYDPGVGTLARPDPWHKFKQDFNAVLGLATGYGLDDKIAGGGYFILPNSWGPKFADKGYARITFDYARKYGIDAYIVSVR